MLALETQTGKWDLRPGDLFRNCRRVAAKPIHSSFLPHRALSNLPVTKVAECLRSLPIERIRTEQQNVHKAAAVVDGLVRASHPTI
jgi:hypothetical protein